MELTDGILVQDVDAEVDTVEGDVMGRVGIHASDETSKKTLRDQLRQTLSKRQMSMGEFLSGERMGSKLLIDAGPLRTRQKGKQVAMDEVAHDWST